LGIVGLYDTVMVRDDLRRNSAQQELFRYPGQQGSVLPVKGVEFNVGEGA
jgi:hypothetical protein